MKWFNWVIGLIFVSSLFYFYFSYKAEMNQNALIKENMDNKDYAYIYDYYFDGKPFINQRPYIGETSASIKMIYVMDFKSDTSRKFYDKIPELRRQYIDNGGSTLYFKYYMTKDEYNNKKGRFLYAMAVYCYMTQLDLANIEAKNFSDNIYNFQKSLFDTTENQLMNNSCIKNNSFKQVQEDMTESSIFRIEGSTLHITINGEYDAVLYGDPTWTQIYRLIREKQVSLGI